MVGGEGRSASLRAERCDEEGVSIDTICTHNFSCLPASISSACPSLRSGLRAVVLVVAHLQRDLKLHLQHRGVASHPQSSIGRGGQLGPVIFEKGSAQFVRARSATASRARMRATCSSLPSPTLSEGLNFCRSDQ